MEPWVLREAASVIDAALKEDLGSGDLTTNACVPEDAAVRGRYIAKEDGVICGLALCGLVFERLGGGVSFTALKKDGEAVKKGETAALVSGNARTILSGERVGLNLLQHLSGIATATARAVKAVSGTGARITDTRKTTPGLRALEKYAVRAGGGVNHRFGLSDGILIKDNHIAAAGGITAAVRRGKEPLSPYLKDRGGDRNHGPDRGGPFGRGRHHHVRQYVHTGHERGPPPLSMAAPSPRLPAIWGIRLRRSFLRSPGPEWTSSASGR